METRPTIPMKPAWLYPPEGMTATAFNVPACIIVDRPAIGRHRHVQFELTREAAEQLCRALALALIERP